MATQSTNPNFTFRDRSEAGTILGNRLKSYAALRDVVVLALPRGGVSVGAEIARILNAPLFPFFVRKLGMPGHQELAIGAITSGGTSFVDPALTRKLQLAERWVAAIIKREKRRLARSEEAYASARKLPDLNGKIVILADDGATTGSTLAMAVQTLRQQGAAQVIVAIPVATHSAVAALSKAADEVACLMEPRKFINVGYWYKDFAQPSDQQICQMLERSGAQIPVLQTA